MNKTRAYNIGVNQIILHVSLCRHPPADDQVQKVLLLLKRGVTFSHTIERNTLFSVYDYGAIGDGIKNDTQAFFNAWNATCNSLLENPKIIVPGDGTFLVHQILFSGPCRAKNIAFLIIGRIVAPDSPTSWSGLDQGRWLTFSEVERLHVTGYGTIDGRGHRWWAQSCRDHPNLLGCTSEAPTAMVFQSCNDSSLTKVNFINSSQVHISIEESNYFQVDNLYIEAPEDSPNTDGIHVHASKHVTITNTMIRTGDDCVSMGDYTSDINISSIVCGPGHGVSIGSLGRSGNFVQVENIHVSRVYFEHTTNGARIKTWQVGRGYVRGVIFEDIKFYSVHNPIIIDQYYCDIRGACEETVTGVHISNVTYSRLSGTSSTDIAINLNCSTSVACTDIVLEWIELSSAEFGIGVTSSCTNAYGSAIGEIQPNPPCVLMSNTSIGTAT